MRKDARKKRKADGERGNRKEEGQTRQRERRMKRQSEETP